MKYQGIVIKLTKNKAIVTANDFQCFYIKRNPTIHVGKQIEFTEKEIIRKRSVMTKLALSAACILIVITCLSAYSGIINKLSEPKVFAFVDVDINPSLELGIDDVGKVLSLVPLNEDAKILTDKLKIGRIGVSEAVDIIIDGVKKDYALSEAKKDYVLISSTLNNKKDENDKEYQTDKKKLNIIMNSVKDNIQENKNVNVFLVQTTIYERKDAQSKGISTGRYALYTKYKDRNKDFSIEDAKSLKINELLEGVLNEDKLTPAPTLIPTATSIVSAMPTSIPTLIPTPTKTPAAIPTLIPIRTNTHTLIPIPTQIPSKKATPIPTTTQVSTPTATIKIINSPFMRLESHNYRGYYIRHQSTRARISSYVTPVEDSIFKMVPGLADPNCISFESKNNPGYYLKHENFELILKQYDGTANFNGDATFRKVPGLADENQISFQSYNFPNRYIRHRDYYLWIEEIVDELGREDATYETIEAQ